MLSFFFKIFFAGICMVLLWICFKKMSILILSLLNSRKSLNVFKDLISNNIYDRLTISRSIKSYISPKCQESHPYKKESRKGKGHVKKEDLTKKLDIFLDYDVACRCLLILANSGMGKTCFALNYFIHNLRRQTKECHKIVLVPLGIKESDELILAPSDKRNKILFLDGFDEDVNAVEDRHKRLRRLMDLGQEYKRVIITCSIDFFPRDKNMPIKYGYERIGPEDINKNYYYQFKKFYLSPFNSNDIKKYIGSIFFIWEIGIKKRIRSFIENNPLIHLNPFLLSHFNKIFQEESTMQSVNDIYEKIVENWISHEPNWENKSLLNLFVQRLAVDIYLGRKERGMESINQNELGQKAKDWGAPFYPLENNMRSLISQTQSGPVKFIHRSIMEYLFIKRLLSGDKTCYQTLLTNQMNKIFLEMLENKNPINLKMEFHWLSQFELMAHGLTIKPSNNNDANQTDLFRTILRKNHQFEFLCFLKPLIQNPIFFEFGWNPELNKNLNEAICQSKTSLMKLPEKKWIILIDQNKIEITKQNQKNKTILINEKDFKEYRKLPNNSLILKLGNTIGLKGLIMLNNINQSKNFCVLPDLKTFQRFTFYFWTKQFN